MMNYRDFFEKAMSEAYREAPVTDDRTFVRMIDERARNMKTNNIKLHRLFTAAAGTAAAVAVVGGSVLGVNYLNEHGGLKEGGGAAYQAENEPAVTTNALMSTADIAEPGVFRYDNCTLYVRDYTFDGMRITLHYDVVYDDPAAVRTDGGPYLPDIVNHPDGTDILTELGLEHENWFLTTDDGAAVEYPEDRPDTVRVTEKLVTMMPAESIRVAFLPDGKGYPAEKELLASGKYDYTIVKNVPDGYISETTDIQVQPEGEERLVRVNICSDCIELVCDEVGKVSLDTLFGAAGTARRTLTVNMKDGSSLTLAPPPGEAIFDKAYGLNNMVFTYYMLDKPIAPAEVDSIYLGETLIYGDTLTHGLTLPENVFTLADGSTGYVMDAVADNNMCRIRIALHSDKQNYFNGLSGEQVPENCVYPYSPDLGNSPADMVETFPWGYNGALMGSDENGSDVIYTFFTPVKGEEFEVQILDATAEDKPVVDTVTLPAPGAEDLNIKLHTESAETGKREITLSPAGFVIEQKGGTYEYEWYDTQLIKVLKNGQIVYDGVKVFCYNSVDTGRQLMYGVYNEPINPDGIYSLTFLGETFVLSDAQTEKQTTIAIDFSRADAELGDFDLWFYIDGDLQEELTRTIGFPGEERIEWDISAETGIHEYRIDVMSRGTGEVGTLFRGQVDFTNDTPKKLFGEGDDMEFNGGVFKKLNEALHGDPSQIAGIYPPEEGQEPLSEEEIEALVAESTERQLAEIKEKSPVLFDLFYNNQDLYASSSDPWLYGDEAWAVLAERGGLDGEYYIKGRENLKDKFTFCHSEFFIEDGGLPVYPFTGGTVEYADWYQGWGRLVLVHSDDGHYWLYYHLADIGVREGDTVTTDTVLGNSGSTGFTTGTQLGIRVY